MPHSRGAQAAASQLLLDRLARAAVSGLARTKLSVPFPSV